MRLMLTIALLVAVLVGSVVAVWGLATSEPTKEDINSVSLAHQLEKISLCANALDALDSSDREKLRRLLESSLGGALQEAEGLIRDHARLDGSFPNLRDGVRRASEYKRDETVAERAKWVLAMVDATSVPETP